MVHPDSNRISRVPSYSGILLVSFIVFVYGPITLFDGAFQLSSTNNEIFDLLTHFQLSIAISYNPK